MDQLEIVKLIKGANPKQSNLKKHLIIKQSKRLLPSLMQEEGIFLLGFPIKALKRVFRSERRL